MRTAPFKLTLALIIPIIVTIMLGPKLSASFFSQDVHGAEAAPARSKAARSEALTPVRVSAFKVQRSTFAETIAASGTVLAEEDVELRAEVGGRVVAIGFQEGARVVKGALLIKLDDAELQALRRRALHRRDLALLRERRLSQLVEQKLVRQEEYDTALSEMRVQEAEIALVEAQIAKTEIRAPFAGVVGLRYVSEGAFVNPASRLATVHGLSRVKIDFSIPERYASRVRIGTPIQIISAAGDQMLGRVYAVDPHLDPLTRTCMLRAIAANDADRLHPGGLAEIRLALEETRDALFVPADAILSNAQGKHVFVVANDQVQVRPIRSGSRTESHVQVVSGLQDGEIVVTSGLQQLRSGSRVVLASLSQSDVAT
jgi:membrane fusion protein (multidrug efflux system)